MTDKLLLTPDEAAQVRNITRSEVYELLNRRQLASVKTGSCRRIPIEAVRVYVARLAS